MTTSRQRVQIALNHREPDRLPLDLGASAVTGMHVSVVYRMRQALGLDEPETPVKVVEPYQMLGEIAPDLLDALGIDIVELGGARTLFGFKNEGWRPWRLFDGTPTLVPEGFNTEPSADGSILMYPKGDRSAPPSGMMPQGGGYFDTIVRQPPIDDDNLNIEDNLEEFGPISDEDLENYRLRAQRLHTQTDKAILANFGLTAFGDIAQIPAPSLKRPKGIRDIQEWYMSIRLRRDHIWRIFERQCEIALANLERIYAVVGDLIDIIFITGTDFGTQRGPFIDLETYRDLFGPFHREVNNWVHSHTGWKTFIHSCGSMTHLVQELIEDGFDILNPVQCSASGMDPATLKERYGGRIVFWGGGVNTQQTLPFGTPEEVRREVRERIEIFAPGGGFVFNPIHNIQAKAPLENLMAMFDAVRSYGRYPIGC